MRGEERPAAILRMEMLDHRPGDGEAVEGRGAAADLVEDDERARAGLVEDRGGLDHLDHEGGAAAGEIVGGADAGEERIDDADMGGFRRHEGPRLGEDGDQRVLAEEGRFAGHVGAGEEVDAAGFRRRRSGDGPTPSPSPQGGGGREAEGGEEGPRSLSLPTKLLPSRRSDCSTTGWRPAFD